MLQHGPCTDANVSCTSFTSTHHLHIIFSSIHTDIEFGNRSNTSTVLVLTGVSTLADVETERVQSTDGQRNMKTPEFYIDSVTEFYNLIKAMDN